MCWNAPVSFATLGVGTLLNVLSYVDLRRSDARHQLWYWQFCLLMQLPEGAAWVAHERGESLAAPSRAAMLLNVAQPLALLGSVVLSRRHLPSVAATACFMYLVLLVSDAGGLWAAAESIAPKPGCAHLNLGYWDGRRTPQYIVANLLGFAAIPSRLWALVNAGIFMVALCVSVALYECGGGSVWCWAIFPAGLLLAAAHRIDRRLARGDS